MIKRRAVSGRSFSKDINVYEAAQIRIKFIFDNFEKVYISFSGGKDSGVMLNLFIESKKTVDPAKRSDLRRRLGKYSG